MWRSSCRAFSIRKARAKHAAYTPTQEAGSHALHQDGVERTRVSSTIALKVSPIPLHSTGRPAKAIAAPNRSTNSA